MTPFWLTNQVDILLLVETLSAYKSTWDRVTNLNEITLLNDTLLPHRGKSKWDCVTQCNDTLSAHKSS